MKHKYKLFLAAQIIIILVGLIILIINKKDYEISETFQKVGTTLISVGIINLAIAFIQSNKQEKQLKDLSDSFKLHTENILNSRDRISDSGIIRIENDFADSILMRNINKEYFSLNTYISNYYNNHLELKKGIANSNLEKINIYLLDIGQNKQGRELLKLRSNALGIEYQNCKSELISNYKLLHSLGEEISSGKISKGKLTEFNLYLYNDIPALFAMKFSPNEIYMRFFFYGVKSNNNFQIVVDANNTNSQINQQFSNHMNLLTNNKNTFKYNLLDQNYLNRLSKQIREIET